MRIVPETDPTTMTSYLKRFALARQFAIKSVLVPDARAVSGWTVRTPHARRGSWQWSRFPEALQVHPRPVPAQRRLVFRRQTGYYDSLAPFVLSNLCVDNVR